MQKRLWIIIILLASITLWGKVMRYHTPLHNIEEHVNIQLENTMKEQGFELLAHQTLTSSGVFSAYHYTHQNCIGELTITPLFKSAEAVSMVQKDSQKPVFYYRHYQGEAFPNWYYLWREGIAPLRRMAELETITFPAVLAIYDPSNCVQDASLSFEEFWQ